MIEPDRVIRAIGSDLLNPSYQPQFPLNMKEDEIVRVIPPCPPWNIKDTTPPTINSEGSSSEDKRYWFLSEAFDRDLPYEIEWTNEHHLHSWGDGRGFDPVPYSNILRISANASQIQLPDMWTPFGGFAMVMNRRLLDLLLSIDAEALSYLPMPIGGMTGELISDAYSLVDVVRNIAAIDVANSVVDYFGPSGGYQPCLLRFVSSRIRTDLDDGISIFRQRSFTGNGGTMVIVSEKLRQAIVGAQPPFTNLRFSSCY